MKLFFQHLHRYSFLATAVHFEIDFGPFETYMQDLQPSYQAKCNDKMSHDADRRRRNSHVSAQEEAVVEKNTSGASPATNTPNQGPGIINSGAKCRNHV